MALGAETLTPVSLQLVWKHQFQFAGYYMAKHKGYFDDAGIDLRIFEYEYDEDPVDQVLNGSRDFAVGRSTILSQRAKGAGIVALLAAYQNSPLMLLTTRQSGITKPADLLNKRIMMTPDAEKQVELLAMLYQSGVSATKFTRQQHSFDIKSLLQGETDAMASYISNEPFQMNQQGKAYNIIHPKNFGFEMYSDLLFTSERLLEQNPALVESFRKASIRGWLYAFSHIEETADLIIQQYNTQHRSRDALIYEGKQLAKLAFDEDGNFGTINQKKIDVILQLYLLFNFISPDDQIGNFIYRPVSGGQLLLSASERQYLATQSQLILCGDPFREPYSQLNNNQYEGIFPDYMKLISERTGLNLSIMTHPSWAETIQAMEKNECDILPGAMQTPERARYMEFSRAFISLPTAFAVNSTTPKNISLEHLLEQPIALVAGSSFVDILKSRFPNTRIVPVTSLKEGLIQLQENKVIALLDAPISISAAINHNGFKNIRIIDKVRDNWDISIAVNQKHKDTPLLHIIDKAIASISQQELESITNKWGRTAFVHQTDHTLLWQTLAGASLLFLFFAYRYRLIHLNNLKLESLARHDPLTGLNNRHTLMDTFANTRAITNRYQRPVSLIFFDLDDFKQINDRFGHFNGDIVLKAVAEILTDNCRDSDIFGRWGGEEFLIILPESNLCQALQSAEKIRSALASYNFYPQIPITVTGSFGVAQLEPDESIDNIIQRADQALYQAKAAGKNRVCKYSDTTDGSEQNQLHG